MQVPDGTDYVEFMLYRKLPATFGTKNHISLLVPDVQKAITQLEARPYFKTYGKGLQMQVGKNGKRQVNLYDLRRHPCRAHGVPYSGRQARNLLHRTSAASIAELSPPNRSSWDSFQRPSREPRPLFSAHPIQSGATMSNQPTRRTFLAAAAAVAACSAIPTLALPPDRNIRFGYTAMTWGEDELQAIDDIAAVGFPGIQFRANAVTEFKPAELKDLLAQHKLTFVALSSGEISLDKPAEEQIAAHLANAQFLKDSGGLYLQVLDQLKSYPRTVTPEECKQLGKLLTELGRRTADLGIPLGYHNHMNTISEHASNLDLVLENSDPKYVKLELDTAHSVAGGGDPAKAIKLYHDRLLFLHLKDVRDAPMTGKAKYPFQWVELGHGRVDLPAVFAALDQVQYKGWAVVELDKVPDPPLTPKQCAIISRDYLKQKIGVNV